MEMKSTIFLNVNFQLVKTGKNKIQTYMGYTLFLYNNQFNEKKVAGEEIERSFVGAGIRF